MKMVYASSKDRFKRELDGIQVELQATDPSEMSFDIIKSRAIWIMFLYDLGSFICWVYYICMNIVILFNFFRSFLLNFGYFLSTEKVITFVV